MIGDLLIWILRSGCHILDLTVSSAHEALRDDDFIVDDEGFGYKDNGGEIWDQAEDEEGVKGSKKKSRKVNVSRVLSN